MHQRIHPILHQIHFLTFNMCYNFSFLTNIMINVNIFPEFNIAICCYIFSKCFFFRFLGLIMTFTRSFFLLFHSSLIQFFKFCSKNFFTNFYYVIEFFKINFTIFISVFLNLFFSFRYFFIFSFNFINFFLQLILLLF